MPPRNKSDRGLHQAFDTIRFGAGNILNLRESLPTPADASARAESWLRQRQVEGVSEVLIISGRGNGSEGGISPVREAIVRLIASMRRRGVVDRYQEHTPGSFSLQLAAVSAMIDAPRRNKDRHVAAPSGRALLRLTKPTEALLRELAERSLDALGVKDTSPFLEAEMARQLMAIDFALPKGADRDAMLRAAISRALAQTL